MSQVDFERRLGSLDLADEATRTDEALKLFQHAITKEQNGAMSDAIEFYRKATKLDPNVEKAYRTHFIASLPPPEPRKTDQVAPVDISKINVSRLLDSFEHCEFSPLDDVKPISLAKLPDEVVVHILLLLMKIDSPAWLNFSMTSKKLAHLSFKRGSVWRRLAWLVYPNQPFQLAELKRHNFELDSSVHLYGGSWHKMLCERPFIKYNGIYISVVNYCREGGKSDGSSAWTNPIRMITYYRYLRFYPDGSCLRSLTTEEPTTVVPAFNSDWESADGKKLFRGHWHISPKGRVCVDTEGPVPTYRFIEELKIKHGSKWARHHKLEWVSSYYVDKRNNEKGTFSLENEKDFSFSRVKSYGSIIGGYSKS